MREEGKGEGAELQRSVEQWQFTTPPSWGVKCLGKFTTFERRAVDQTSLQPSEPDRGGSGEQERVSSSEADNKLKAQFLLPVNKKAQNYKEWRNRDLFSDDQLTLQPKLQAEFFSSIAVGLLRLLFKISEKDLRILIFLMNLFR